MDMKTESGSQSAPNELGFGGSDTTVPEIENSHANLNSSNSKGDSNHMPKATDDDVLAEADPLLPNTEAKKAIAEADIQNNLKDPSKLDRPGQSDEGTLNDKTSTKRSRGVDTDSESHESNDSDESDESYGFNESNESGNGPHTKAVRKMARKYKPKTLFSAYQKSVENRHVRREESKHEGSNLVQGLMDYMRVLEKRMDKLEANTSSNSALRQQDVDIGSNPTGDGDDPIILGVRFFNSANHIRKYGGYVGVHAGTQRGTYMCDRDPKYLIRVLYSWLNRDVDQPSENPVSEPPNANDIDIITFGVQSEPITTFFEKKLDINLGANHLIRFEKPFKAVIRNIGRVKEQLLKLENNSESVAESAQQSKQIALDAEANHKKGSHLPFSPNQEDGTRAFDKPAALPHFQRFVAFVDEYLGEKVNLFNRLRERKEESVAFENLWMLFDSRDTIYCPLRQLTREELDTTDRNFVRPVPRHTPQAYRVTATVGGTPIEAFLTSPDEANIVSTSITPMTVNGAPSLPVPTSLVPISSRVRSNYNALFLYCLTIDFNGLAYGTVRDYFGLKPYDGELDIRSLQAYPIEYATNDGLSNRGKTFLQLTRPSHRQYEGLTIGLGREEINSPVIVDIKLAFEGDQSLEKQSIGVPKFISPLDIWLSPSHRGVYDVVSRSTCSHPWCYDRACTSNIYNDSQSKGRYPIVDETEVVLEEYETLKQHGSAERRRFRHLMESKDLVRLLPGTVPGFALRNRRWVLLDINLLKDVEQDNEWKNLFLPKGHQQMVQAMVETHANDKETKGMDLVRGKGKGCIILLHGVPGVGKTSTAECIAAHTKKPLYPITCGDIGYNAEDVERNMESHFKLAHRWDCVLLLDEADVFLAKRDQKDVQRNGLVSVFLRILEYYPGILFLTTNRVGTIDDAFRSRLHLILYYPKLTKELASNIFSHNFARIADINIERKKMKLPPFEYADAEDEVLKWAKKNHKTLGWNGRQIRNAFQTVLALSEFHARGKKNKSKNEDKQANPVVKLKYFKSVANAAIQFNEYLKATHGYDEERVAKRDFIRAVEFSPKSNPLFTETEDSPNQSSDEGGSSNSESDSNQTRNQDHSTDSDSDYEKGKKKKSKSKSEKESSSKNAVKKGKKVKHDKVKSEKSKDKKKEKEEKEESGGSE
ncbi:hypothetical protein F4803DRAFT_544743 [Xylaria telfairii]|nr:hypothetical protein F4803DRAFT_544743 [Xylaria telfairii]